MVFFHTQSARRQFSGPLQDCPHTTGIWCDSDASVCTSWTLYQRKVSLDFKGRLWLTSKVWTPTAPWRSFFSGAVSEDRPPYDLIQRILIMRAPYVFSILQMQQRMNWKRRGGQGLCPWGRKEREPSRFWAKQWAKPHDQTRWLLLSPFRDGQTRKPESEVICPMSHSRTAEWGVRLSFCLAPVSLSPHWLIPCPPECFTKTWK